MNISGILKTVKFGESTKTGVQIPFEKKVFYSLIFIFSQSNFIQKYIFRYSRTLGCAIHPHAHPEKWKWFFWMCFRFPNLSPCILLTSDMLFLTFSLPLINYCCTSKVTFNKFQNQVWASLVAQRLKHLPGMWETQVQSLGQEDPLEKEMATHSSTLAWRIPRREEPGFRIKYTF